MTSKVVFVLVNLVYYFMGWPLDTPPVVASGPGVAADADIIARYGADDDEAKNSNNKFSLSSCLD